MLRRGRLRGPRSTCRRRRARSSTGGSAATAASRPSSTSSRTSSGSARRTDATLNDVFLAIVGGGLRRFLSELGELPDAPLVAFLPVNVRPKDDEGGGNAVGAILATLATDVDDPGRAAAARSPRRRAAPRSSWRG